MSLATRCPHCSTVFKVVQDQLKMSGGWVRCGRCNEPFSALESLFDMASEAPPPRGHRPTEASFEPTPAPGPAPDFDLDLPPSPQAVESAMQSLLGSAPPPLPETDEVDALDSRHLLPPSPERRKLAAGRSHAGPDFADAEFPEDWSDETAIWAASEASAPARGIPSAPQAPDPLATPQAPGTALSGAALAPPGPQPLPTQAAAPAPPDPGPAAPLAPTEAELMARAASPASSPAARRAARNQAPKPDFVRQAERQALWRQPAVRGLLAGLSLALGLLLGAQLAHQHRSQLAAAAPVLAPWLQAWCDQVGCRIEALRDLDALQVDAITLARTPSEGPDTYRLNLAIRNHATAPRAWPHIDLTLTDADGTVLSRRQFSVSAALLTPPTPGQPLRPLPEAVPPDATTPLQWRLQAPNLQLASYTVELFYP